MDFLEKVERQLDLPPAEKSQVMRELKSHYEEMRDQLIASGTDPAVAEEETARKMGEPGDIAARLSAVHNRASWKSALLAAVPFLGLFAVVIPEWTALKLGTPGGLVVILLFGALMLAVSIREFRADRRPIWLTTWFAAGLLAANGVTHYVVFVYIIGPEELRPMAAWLPLAGALVWSLVPPLTIALLVFRGVRGWSMAVAVTTLVIAAAAVAAIRNPEGLFQAPSFVATALVGMLLWVAVGIRLFARHRYGSWAPASLFLFGYLAPTMSNVAVPSGAIWHVLLGHLLLATTVVVFARTASSVGKVSAIWCGLLLKATWGATLVYIDRPESLLQFSLFAAIKLVVLLIVVILLPLLLERRIRMQSLRMIVD